MPEEDIIGAAAYPYTDEVLVEVTCRDADGTLVVHSYQFDPDNEGAAPKGQVPERHRGVVVDALAEKGFDPDASLVN